MGCTKLGFKHMRSWEKIVIATDDEEMLRMMKVFGWMIPGEFKTFGVGDLEAAKAWVAS